LFLRFDIDIYINAGSIQCRFLRTHQLMLHCHAACSSGWSVFMTLRFSTCVTTILIDNVNERNGTSSQSTLTRSPGGSSLTVNEWIINKVTNIILFEGFHWSKSHPLKESRKQS
jgi:hypothetical protein